MTKLSRQQALGNAASASVAYRLSEAGCLVRHVAEGTDIGVDLYCESTSPSAATTQRHAFLHFFVQVKAGDQCRMTRGRASIRVDLEHLEYWDRQPVPTFIALVPRLGAREPIYIVDVAASKLGPRRTANAARSARLTSAVSLRKPSDVRTFLAEHVPSATALLHRDNGVIAPDPARLQSYVRTFHALHDRRVAPWARRIENQLRTTSAMTVIIAWRTGELTEGALDGSRPLLGTLLTAWAQFDAQPGRDRHWEIFFAAALLAHLDANHSSAAIAYQLAIDVIDADQKIHPLSKEWRRDREEVRRCLAAARRKTSLRALRASLRM